MASPSPTGPPPTMTTSVSYRLTSRSLIPLSVPPPRRADAERVARWAIHEKHSAALGRLLGAPPPAHRRARAADCTGMSPPATQPAAAAIGERGAFTPIGEYGLL